MKRFKLYGTIKNDLRLLKIKKFEKNDATKILSKSCCCPLRKNTFKSFFSAISGVPAHTYQYINLYKR